MALGGQGYLAKRTPRTGFLAVAREDWRKAMEAQEGWA